MSEGETMPGHPYFTHAPPIFGLRPGSEAANNCGKFYATLKPPFLPRLFAKEFLIELRGTICNGRDNRMGVEYHLYNHFPEHGKGWTYLSWRAAPDFPEKNKHPRTGDVKDPMPFCGNLDEWRLR